MNYACLAAGLVALTFASAPNADAASRHGANSPMRQQASGSWDGRWAGAWGGRDATAVIVRGGHVVAYEYGGQTNPVSHSRVTPSRIVYGDNGVTVTLTRTGANSAHATIKTGQGNGDATLTRG